MITVPAHRVKQFGVEFFQASFSAKDIDRLVKFEVLGYAGKEVPDAKAKRANRARVNWEMLEKRIGESEAAYQRPVIRKKIDELAAYYRECKDAATLPALSLIHISEPQDMVPDSPGNPETQMLTRV